MIKLPERKLKKASEMMNMNIEQQKLYCCEINAWNACVDEYEVLNATAQPVSDGWVKCSERMPDKENYYLTYSNAGVDVTYFDGEIFSDKHAAHWMPLPAAPGGQDD
ncbi:DUF551 domain-containing protein [Pantoea ananatis]|uniref:DUF551 domain-containing protein n=1 Tax=Pantoea ananas TaxID=553 RepID=UPI001B314C14|nr:DUF551 domain-containing protein [Pantoea ananatis]